MPDLHILPALDSAARAAAELVAGLAAQRAQSQGPFTIALSGGSTPRRLYELLASPTHAGHIAWDRWHVFWGDERCVPPDHPDSNYRMAKEALLDRVPIPPPQVHRMRGETAPPDAAQEYEQALRRVFGASWPAFDLILLGLGDDGHTASLFPGTDALQEGSRLVVANWVPRLQTYRLTFTLLLINAARVVAFLAAGESKAVVVEQVLRAAPGAAVPPAALVRPASGLVHWFLTREAASRLEGVGA